MNRTNLQLKSDDPSGASPLRDRQAGLHSERDYHFFAVRLKCVTPESDEPGGGGRKLSRWTGGVGGDKSFQRL